MAVLGWHRVRVPGGLTPEGLAIAQDEARSIMGHGASQVFVVKVCDDTIQFLDLWPDRATFERFTDWAMVAMASDEPKHWDLMGGEYVQGGDGNGEVIFALP